MEIKSLLKTSLYVIPLLLLGACEHDRQEFHPDEIKIDVGVEHTKINWSNHQGTLNVYRFTNSDCDINNYASCDNSQLTTVSSSDDLPIIDDFFNINTEQEVYIKITSDVSRSDLVLLQAKAPQFPARYGHQLVKFKKRMFIIGGHLWTPSGGDINYNDVWSSENGISWKLETEQAEFPPIEQHQVVEFKDKLWLFPNKQTQDIWSSEDGVNWLSHNLNIPIMAVYTAILNDRIWVFGNDEIYSSETGENWVLEVDNWSDLIVTESSAPPSKRFRGQSVVFNDKIWIIAGQSFNDNSAKNDVWSTLDGINWLLENDNAQFQARLGHAVTTFNNKLWMSSGSDTNDSSYNDIWSSNDGINWQLENDNMTQRDHQNHQMLEFNSQMWLYGSLSDKYFWQSDNGKNWYVPSLVSLQWQADN